MPRGQADWFVEDVTTTQQSIDPINELAVRLGATARFYPSGNIIHQQDFEGGRKDYQFDASGAGASVALDTTKSNGGVNSCKIVCPNTAGTSAWYRYREGMLGASSIGLHVAFDTSNTSGHIIVDLQVYTNLIAHPMKVRYNPSTFKWSILTTGSVWTEVATYNANNLTTGLKFAHMKIVADLANKYYVKLLINNQVIDLTAYRYPFSAVGAFSEYLLNIGAAYVAGESITVFIDNVLVTTNEDLSI